MHWQKTGLPQGRKTASMKFGLLEFFFFFHFHFFIFTNGGRIRNVCQSQDSGILEDLFAVCPETWVALDTANLITLFAEVWRKCTNLFLVETGNKCMCSINLLLDLLV